MMNDPMRVPDDPDDPTSLGLGARFPLGMRVIIPVIFVFTFIRAGYSYSIWVLLARDLYGCCLLGRWVSLITKYSADIQ